MITKEQRLAFLHDLQAVCGKHNLSLGHEDEHGDERGTFLVHPLNDVYREWLSDAHVMDKNRPKEELDKEKAEENRRLEECWKKEQKRRKEEEIERAITKHHKSIF